MPRFRFSLLALFGFVAVVAIACAALANPTEAWAIATVTLSLAFLACSMLAAIYGFGQRRAFWLGFSIFGWGHILLFLLLKYLKMADGGNQFLSHVATFRTIEAAYEKEIATKLLFGTVTELVTDENGVSIGIALSSLLLGVAGGIVARHLYLRREKAVPKN